ncbi:MAG: CDP-diacylglycerol--glycerol-3-phosphate 3-phosphatidyltransferase [Oscillospiraceae bacterium]|jgi:CDP-diacylglycerol--glycerol-3-phosphate 3-phosphatidyltransferase|nr:CDP-diacylglycerol--glycerol-3-phosphate 3-phosphatidyltransferase [Oscillospiraceae bacterium]
MNLPNKLTLLRVALVPLYLLLLGLGATWCRVLALLVFVVAALTDLFDGRIARAAGLVTNFGKFMDPIADKLLVIPALVLMVQMAIVPAWMCIIFVAREFIISGLRLIAASRGTVIAAGVWGKLKTVAQLVAVALLTVPWPWAWLSALGMAWLYAATALTILSCAVYVWQGRALLSDLEDKP